MFEKFSGVFLDTLRSSKRKEVDDKVTLVIMTNLGMISGAHHKTSNDSKSVRRNPWRETCDETPTLSWREEKIFLKVIPRDMWDLPSIIGGLDRGLFRGHCSS